MLPSIKQYYKYLFKKVNSMFLYFQKKGDAYENSHQNNGGFSGCAEMNFISCLGQNLFYQKVLLLFRLRGKKHQGYFQRGRKRNTTESLEIYIRNKAGEKLLLNFTTPDNTINICMLFFFCIEGLCYMYYFIFSFCCLTYQIMTNIQCSIIQVLQFYLIIPMLNTWYFHLYTLMINDQQHKANFTYK